MTGWHETLSASATGDPSVIWEFVWEIKSLYGKRNLDEINELKAVRVKSYQ